MHTLNLSIEDDFFPHFKAILDSFIKDKKVQIIENELPANVIVSSIEEVHRRVAEAESEVGMSEEEYNRQMNRFFSEELGIKR